MIMYYEGKGKKKVTILNELQEFIWFFSRIALSLQQENVYFCGRK